MTEKTIAPELDDEFVVQPPDISHLITEDDTPVDNIFSERQMALLRETLYTSWAGPGDGRTFVAMGNVAIYAATHLPPLVPDMLVSLDVTLPADPFAKEHRCYFLWEYGKPPEVVVEIVSNRKGGELANKLLDYARLGVAYYVVYDPDSYISQESLRIFTRQAASFVETTERWLAQVEWGLPSGKATTVAWSAPGSGGVTATVPSWPRVWKQRCRNASGPRCWPPSCASWASTRMLSWASAGNLDLARQSSSSRRIIPIISRDSPKSRRKSASDEFGAHQPARLVWKVRHSATKASTQAGCSLPGAAGGNPERRRAPIHAQAGDRGGRYVQHRERRARRRDRAPFLACSCRSRCTSGICHVQYFTCAPGHFPQSHRMRPTGVDSPQIAASSPDTEGALRGVQGAFRGRSSRQRRPILRQVCCVEPGGSDRLQLAEISLCVCPVTGRRVPHWA